MIRIKLIVLSIAFLLTGVFASMAKTPQIKLGFIPNKGQYTTPVLYSYSGNLLNVELRESGFSYTLLKGDSKTNYEQGKPSRTFENLSAKKIDIDLLGANLNSLRQEFEVGDGYVLFRDANNIDISYTVNHYKRVVYKEVYPNIDIEFLVSDEVNAQESFKYNFILHPGANSQHIKLKISGAQSTEINSKGALQMNTGDGVLEERIPLSYELLQNGNRGKEIHVGYTKTASNIFGFNCSKHSLNKTLIIDPIAWSTYFGGAATEYIEGTKTDAVGNVYALGRTLSSTGITTPGSYQENFASSSGYDAFLAKFSSTGNLLWATYFGGTADDASRGITTDNAGNILICGATNSTSGIASSGALQPALIGSIDGFIAKFSPSGSLIWSTYFGYDGLDQFLGICTDKANDVYACGSSGSTSTIINGPHQNSNAGATDGFIVKISANGQTLHYATYYGGNSTEYVSNLCADANKNLYFCGYTSSSSGISSANGYQKIIAGASDGFYGKLDSLGKRVYGTYFGASNNDYLYDIIIDSETKLDLVGISSSTTGIATVGAFQTTFGGGSYDAFILRADTNGTPIWCTYWGGDKEEYLYGICSDASSNLFVVGASSTATGMATSGAFQLTIGGSFDAIVGQFDKTGARIWSSYFGGPSSDYGRVIAISPTNDLYILGEAGSSTNIATVGAYRTTISGSNDVFIAKIPIASSGPTPISNNIISPNQGVCLGNAAQTLVGTTPTGGDGMFNYQWLSSPTGLAGSFVPAFGTNANDTYIPGSLTVNTYYKRVVFSGTQTDTSNMISVLVSASLSAGFTVNKTIQCLKNNQFVFTDTTTSSAGTLSYWWDFGNGKTSTNQTDTISYAASVDNLFKVRLVTSLNGGCADTSDKQVILINNPLAKTITGKDTVMKGTTELYTVPSTNGSSYGWYYTNGTGRSTTNSISIKWTLQGDVHLALLETNGGGCKGDTAYKNIYVKLPTSEEELFGSALSIYPNPSEGIITIETGSLQSFNVKIISLSGQIIYSNKGEGQIVIDLNTEAAGIYLLELTTEQGQSLHRKIQLIR